MYEQTDLTAKKRIVEAMKHGLYEAKEEFRNEGGVVNNSLSFKKLDKIANNLIKKFENEGSFAYVLCRRGWYTVLFLYNKEEKTLYSFLSENRFSELLNRKTIDKPHYIDALIEFNIDLQPKRIQQVLIEGLFDKENNKVDELKAKIVAMLNNDEPQKYITVCHSIDGFRLCAVRAVITSRYLEIIEDNDWSEYIDIDYSETIFDDVPRNAHDDEVKVALKSNLPKPPNNHDDFKIPVKVEKSTKNKD